MLASILPGVRDLRTPLVAGYVWLACLWFLVADHLPVKGHETGVLHNVSIAAENLGRPVWGAVLTFAAYLLGSMLQISRLSTKKFDQEYFLALMTEIGSESTSMRFTVKMANFMSPLRKRKDLYVAVVDFCERKLMDLADTGVPMDEALHRVVPVSEVGRLRVLLTSATSKDEPYSEDFIIALSLLMLRESEQMAARLSVENRPLFEDYDRLRAEGELRLTIAPALLALSIVLASLWTPIALAPGLTVAGFLMLQGVGRQTRADSVLYQALTLGYTASPIMLRVETAALALLEREKGDPAGAAEQGEPTD